MVPRTTALCPVCKTILGSLVPREVCSFLCPECKWIFSWSGHGKLLVPVKHDKQKPKICGCASCQERDERRKFI